MSPRPYRYAGTTVPPEDRTPAERAQAAAYAELTPKTQRVAREYLALEVWEKLLIIGPHLPGYPHNVARVIRQLDALNDAEWDAFARYARVIYDSLDEKDG